MTRCLFSKEEAIAYSATTVLPAEVCADTVEIKVIKIQQLSVVKYNAFTQREKTYQEHFDYFQYIRWPDSERNPIQTCTLLLA